MPADPLDRARQVAEAVVAGADYTDRLAGVRDEMHRRASKQDWAGALECRNRIREIIGDPAWLSHSPLAVPPAPESSVSARLARIALAAIDLASAVQAQRPETIHASVADALYKLRAACAAAGKET